MCGGVHFLRKCFRKGTATPNFEIKMFIAKNNSIFQGTELYFGDILKHHENLQYSAKNVIYIIE